MSVGWNCRQLWDGPDNRLASPDTAHCFSPGAAQRHAIGIAGITITVGLCIGQQCCESFEVADELLHIFAAGSLSLFPIRAH